MQHPVQPASLQASRIPGDTLLAEHVGPGVGVAAIDPVRGVAGLLHFTDPDSKIDPTDARQHPGRFADTGVEQLLRKVVQLGGRPGKLTVKIAGVSQTGSKVNDDIARRNYAAVRKALWRAGAMIDAEDVGGDSERCLVVSVGDAAVLLKKNDQGRTL